MAVSAVRKETLSKEERLTRKKIIEELYTSGEVIKTPAIILLYRFLELPGRVPSQVVFSVGKKNFKKAHDRNRIKRLFRECYRKNKHPHYQALENGGRQAAMMFIFTGRTLPDHDYVNDKITELLARFVRVINSPEIKKSNE